MTRSNVILKWNPAISSYNMLSFLYAIAQQETNMDWSIWEHEKVHCGDNLFLLKVGAGVNGIVAAGKIISEPSVDEDWSGKDRVVYYCDFKFSVMINPSSFSLLSSDKLAENMPDFDWHGGHSGMVLNEQQGKIMKKLWKAYLQDHAPEFKSRLDLMESREMFNDQLFIPRITLSALLKKSSS